MTMTLDPADPFERAVIDIVETNRRKRADYTRGKWDENFVRVADQTGLTREQVVECHIGTKQARLFALTHNDRPPANESIRDTKLDRAVYSIIALAMDMEDEPPVKTLTIPKYVTTALEEPFATRTRVFTPPRLATDPLLGGQS